ncbi:YitT family protein [Paenibacillus sp. GYB003]|uniref:YitT family protein n=1 Tax=Paenibacillus sp. GYB003 TaxID=2994392 RepID=UPI002F961F8E
MQFVLQFAAIWVGSSLLAFGVDAFLSPYRLIDGGFIGVGLLLHYYFGALPGLAVFWISAPVFIGVFFYDKALFWGGINGLLVSSLLIDAFAPAAGWFRLGILLHAVIGGWLIGMGVGIMLAYRTNSGGTDLIGQMLADRTGVPAAVFILAFDFAVLSAGLPVIGVARTVFSLLTITVVFVATLRYAARKPLGRSIHFYWRR